jgi:TRAP-type C4-dicarboxylate transport system substrate-binding protein
MGNPMFVDMMNALGGNGVAMGYDQVFSALQTGVVDGAENNPPSFVFDNHYQVAKYYTLTEHLIVPEILVFSRATWDDLSKDDQALVKKLAREAQLEERQLWKKVEDEAMAKMKAAGIEVDTVPDKAPFEAAVKPVWDKYGAKYKGADQAHSGSELVIATFYAGNQAPPRTAPTLPSPARGGGLAQSQCPASASRRFPPPRAGEGSGGGGSTAQ